MQKQEQITNKISYVLMALLLITYIFFPSWYQSVSQKLFGAVYTHHATSLSGSSFVAGTHTVSASAGLLPLFVIARPPQTPYDYVITTVSDRYQSMIGATGRWYVYDASMRPIGYVEDKHASLFAVILFSAPTSDELFSVNGHISRGTGEGGGSFSLQVPIDVAISVGMPIVHQVTGEVASAVVAIERVPEKHIQRVVGVLGSSPLEMAVVYMAQAPRTASLPEPLETTLDAVEELSADAQSADEDEKQEQGGDSDDDPNVTQEDAEELELPTE